MNASTDQLNAPPNDLDPTCPYLGISDDKATNFAFATLGNYCHRARPPEMVELAHQGASCLSAAHQDCPVFQAEAWSSHLPKGLGSQGRRRQSKIRGVSILFFGVAAVGLVLFLLQSPFLNLQAAFVGSPATSTSSMPPSAVAGPDIIPAVQATPNSALITTSGIARETSSPPTITLAPTPTHTLTPEPTATHLPTATPTPAPPTPGPGLGTSFGPGSVYLIHQVEAGESLSLVADLYDTSEAVLLAANRLPRGGALWLDTYLVVLPGCTDTAGIPMFLPVYIGSDTELETLALLYESDMKEIRHYNELGTELLIPGERWLIIPIPAETPTA